jgi:hypothetical protein
MFLTKYLFALVVLVPQVVNAQNVVVNSCGPASAGPVCISTPVGQPIEMWPGGTPRMRWLGATFAPIGDNVVTLGDATHRFVGGYFTSTVDITSTAAGVSNGFNLTSAGQVFVGLSSTSATESAILDLNANSSAYRMDFRLLADGSGMLMSARDAFPIVFKTNNVERFRLESTALVNIIAPVRYSASTGTLVANVGANSCGTTTAAIAGNETLGIVTVGAGSGTQCRITFATAAVTRRVCQFEDESTKITIQPQYVDTTHTDVIGIFGAGDVITYRCDTY